MVAPAAGAGFGCDGAMRAWMANDRLPRSHKVYAPNCRGTAVTLLRETAARPVPASEVKVEQ
jgi:hypothetical protein